MSCCESKSISRSEWIFFCFLLSILLSYLCIKSALSTTKQFEFVVWWWNWIFHSTHNKTIQEWHWNYGTTEFSWIENCSAISINFIYEWTWKYQNENDFLVFQMTNGQMMSHYFSFITTIHSLIHSFYYNHNDYNFSLDNTVLWSG